ncbi:Sphingosine N-acyltransferase lag1 isoform B [Elsinoe australis]|uniref:Sphingosine N-acyltransferase lag1 isoform B n=1 Tax=Elsinoe australis TaxID=40998 RepID=A0A2P7YL22_9PEZI|nr:Sphingosine N-acyltransferase lag1 isoform B [Elsinoe australis]
MASRSLTCNYAWNPAVGTACTGLWLDYYVCVGVTGAPSPTVPSDPHPTTPTVPSGPSPTQAGLISSCTRFHEVVSGDTCDGIQRRYNTFSLADFYAWNPAVGTNCASLWLSYFVCIGVPGTPSSPTVAPPPPPPPAPTTQGPQPQQPGIPASCNNFYLVQGGEWCQKIADQYRIGLNQFYSWNPSVGSSCGSLWGGYYVCVGSW